MNQPPSMPFPNEPTRSIRDVSEAVRPPDENATLEHGPRSHPSPPCPTEAEDTTFRIVEENQPTSRQIGPYCLIQRIGAGGMGEVWVAEQSMPVKRRVALKLIKDGVGSKEIIARFEAERQALALMNHPNIARILDAGTTAEGQPFFVMELVAGKPLTTWCDENQLSVDDRLKLFGDVCSGVQHAHQKGIIHRDLKPGNIIVGLQDGVAVPKIIDFGLAKAMESQQRLTDQSLFTGVGQILGTLKYMSPEQACLDNADIDTRADIYAMGVILYELLTGSTPLDDSSIRGQAALKVLELIRDKEPVKPSRKLDSSTDEKVSGITGLRRTDSVRLKRILAGDLDWIVMKALEKDRTRRYESASGFAADIRRYLNSEPVIARPPSLNYRFRKFVRKNRLGVISASLVVLALIGGIVGSGLGLWEAKRQERIAKREVVAKVAALAEEARQRKEAILAKEESERRRQEAETNLAFARKGNEILGSVFADLNPNAEYYEVSDLRNALRGNLEKASKELEGSAIGDPLTVAIMQNGLGRSLLGLGQYVQAIEILERSVETLKSNLGPNHPDTLNCMNDLALGYLDSSQLDKALPLMEETLSLMKSILGPSHPDTLNCMNSLAAGYLKSSQLDKALPLMEKTLSLMKETFGPDHPKTQSSMNNLAAGHHDAGQLDKALPLMVETLSLTKRTLGPEHPRTLSSMNNLARLYESSGRLDKALPLYEETLALLKSQFGADHPHSLVGMANLAGGYHSAGQMDKALPMYKNALALMKSKLGPNHPETLSCMGCLADGYSSVGQLDKALPLYEETLALTKNLLGPDHPQTLISMNSLADGYRVAGQLDKALPLLEETLPLMKSQLGPDHPQTLISMNSLSLGYLDAGQLDKALPLLEETLPLMKKKLGPDHPVTMTSMNNLAIGYWSTKQLDRSVPLLEAVLEMQINKLGREHPDTQLTVANLGANYKGAGRLDDAIPLLEEAFESSTRIPSLAEVKLHLRDAYIKGQRGEKFDALARGELAEARKNLPNASIELADLLVSNGQDYMTVGNPGQAGKLFAEGLENRQTLTPDAWNTFNVQSLLGGAFLKQATGTIERAEQTRFLAEAEKLLPAAYEGLQQRAPSIAESNRTQTLAETLDRLIELYTVNGNADELNKWHAEKERLTEEIER